MGAVWSGSILFSRVYKQIANKNVVCLLHLLHILICTPEHFNHGSKHYEPWSECSYGSSLGPYCLPKYISRWEQTKIFSPLIASAAYIHMQSRTLLTWKQTLWTLIRLLLWEQSDLDPYCLPKYLSRWEQTEKMWSAYWVCCIYSYALQNTFTVEAYTMNPDQTAPIVWSGSLLFAKVHKQMRANKRCGLLIVSAAYRTLLTWKQTLWTLIRLHLLSI